MEEAFATLLDPAKATTEAEFEAAWEECLLQAPAEKPLTIRPRARRVPRVGTTTERSSASNQRKLEALMKTPPPPPPRRQQPRAADRKGPTTQLEELFGDLSDIDDDKATPTDVPQHGQAEEPPNAKSEPEGPPPIKVHIDGHDIEVPYFAAIISRKYKARVGLHRYVLRFDQTGQCGYIKKLPR